MGIHEIDPFDDSEEGVETKQQAQQVPVEFIAKLKDLAVKTGSPTELVETLNTLLATSAAASQGKLKTNPEEVYQYYKPKYGNLTKKILDRLILTKPGEFIQIDATRYGITPGTLRAWITQGWLYLRGTLSPEDYSKYDIRNRVRITIQGKYIRLLIIRDDEFLDDIEVVNLKSGKSFNPITKILDELKDWALSAKENSKFERKGLALDTEELLKVREFVAEQAEAVLMPVCNSNEIVCFKPSKSFLDELSQATPPEGGV